jgi:sirohydrochlorin ferrochelatase
MNQCPPWCVADHATEDEPGSVRHRGVTHVVPVVLEGRGSNGPHANELLVEVSRCRGEMAVWVYLGDGWTGFSLSLESAERLTAALVTTLRATGTLDSTGL